MSISSSQRFAKARPCQICDGHPDMPTGKRRRCTGYLSGDGTHAYCTREERAGNLEPQAGTEPPAYAHRLDGECRCGLPHAKPGIGRLHAARPERNDADTWRPLSPLPDSAPPPTFDHRDRGEPSNCWAYLDEKGRPIYYRARFDSENGDKAVLPRTYCEGSQGRRRWMWADFPRGDRPLYGLDRLAARPDAPVLVVEGEKTADAAQALLREYVVITWPGGADGVEHAAWRQIRGRALTFWPDADVPDKRHPAGKGVHAARRGAACAVRAGASARVVDLPAGLPAGWDLADPLPEGLTLADVAQLIADARELADQVADAADLDPQAEEEPSPPSRFRLWSHRELADRPPPEWLIADTLVAGGVAVLYGPSGGSKSFQVINMAACIATGQPWNGRAVTHGPVVYVSGEGASGIPQRLDAWARHHGVSEVAGLGVVLEAVNLMEPAAVAEFVAAVRAVPDRPALIVLDTLARCIVGGDENSAQDMGVVIDRVDRIRRETGAAVLLVHHTGKGSGRFGADIERGSSALRGAADTMILVKPDGDLITLSCEKQKDAPPFSPSTWKLQAIANTLSAVPVPVITSGTVDTVSNGAKPLTANDETVLECVRVETERSGGVILSDVARMTGLEKSSVHRSLGRLRNAQYLLYDNGKKLYHVGRSGRSVPLGNSERNGPTSDVTAVPFRMPPIRGAAEGGTAEREAGNVGQVIQLDQPMLPLAAGDFEEIDP